MGSLRVRHDWAISLSLFTFMRWRRKWQPTPVFLPGESQGRGSLVGCRLWGRTGLDTTEVTWQQQQQQQQGTGEGGEDRGKKEKIFWVSVPRRETRLWNRKTPFVTGIPNKERGVQTSDEKHGLWNQTAFGPLSCLDVSCLGGTFQFFPTMLVWLSSTVQLLSIVSRQQAATTPLLDSPSS